MQENFVYSPSNYPFGGLNPNNLTPYTSWPENAVNSPPVSTAVYGTTTTASWAHTVPSLMPWMPENNSSNVDPIVRFSAPIPPDPCTSKTATAWELLNNLGASKTNANLHLKRRTELDELEVAPQKQCITEEKMAARMQEMHISNNYTVPLENSPFGPYGCDYTKTDETPKTLQELEAMLPPNAVNKNIDLSNCSVVLAPEIKSLVEPEKLFAKTILNRIERPTMALVLWKPPNGSIQDIMRHDEKDDKTSNDTNESIMSSTAPLSSLMSGMQESNNNPFSTFMNGKSAQELLSSYFSVPSSSSAEDVSMEA